MATTHGLHKHPLHGRWLMMRDRCRNPNNPCFERYGGRGIDVCLEWDDFKNFYDWSLENGWSPELVLDRVENSKGYTPENCRYTTVAVNNRNKRNNINITYQQRTQCLRAWADALDINYLTLYARIHKLGWSVEKAFNTPTRLVRKSL